MEKINKSADKRCIDKVKGDALQQSGTTSRATLLQGIDNELSQTGLNNCGKLQILKYFAAGIKNQIIGEAHKVIRVL